jgi:hypothetical protein
LQIIIKYADAFTLENPETSLLWHVDAVTEALENIPKIRFDYCQFGLKVQKKTTIAAWPTKTAVFLKRKQQICHENCTSLIKNAQGQTKHSGNWNKMSLQERHAIPQQLSDIMVRGLLQVVNGPVY